MKRGVDCNSVTGVEREREREREREGTCCTPPTPLTRKSTNKASSAATMCAASHLKSHTHIGDKESIGQQSTGGI